jgi:3D (Asp-Asp-Asp) domain-containing protein
VRARALLFALSLLLAAAAAWVVEHHHVECRRVTATAYNSVRWQTQGDPTLTAWGDRLEPGMKAIAVSRDLIGEGLTHRTEVRISGLAGVYVVRDKMNRRFTGRIDIYMGKDVAAAREWGRREVDVCW